MAYDHKEIEKKAQAKWATAGNATTDLANEAKDPYYLLVEFPYPSGDLHIGHWYAFALPDIYARMLRMRGKNVLFPIGFDAFGLPAENAAIKRGEDPKEWTYKNMERMRGQLKSMGASFDWSKEVVTCEPEYYKWTQWLFTKLFEHNLAEHREASVKWCPKDRTVLANEQVIDGKCERCDTPVEEKRLTQWFLKITDYAKRLVSDLEPLPWREEIKEAQRAWIGESEGAKLKFSLQLTVYSEQSESVLPTVERELPKVEIFTTRPDTVFGATYVVLAPEHPLVSEFLELLDNETDVTAYRALTGKKTERERSENKDKTGIRLEGIMAVNPATKEPVPIFIADYVLASYGTGAIMAVPAHDERDYEFAKKMGIPVTQVVAPTSHKTTGGDAVHEGEPYFERDAVMCIVKHWEKDEYLCIEWKDVPDIRSFISGGIELGETPEEAGAREIKEESGYLHANYVRPIGGFSYIEFYHQQKKKNIRARFRYLYFELADGAKETISKEEEEKHTLAWKKVEDVPHFITLMEKDALWERFNGLEKPFTGDGTLVNSGDFSGRYNREAFDEIVTFCGGEKVTQYRIRDWLISRQRYWGCPIPVVYDPEGKPHAIPPEHLPWTLPTDVSSGDGKDGKSPLSQSKELHERVMRIFGEGWTPEYDTFDVFMDSAWYYARYLDSKNAEEFSNASLMKKWLPVNRYSGGSEHTTVHLLYARFFYKALYDLALVPTPEPFIERFNRGIVLGTDGQKMSKRWGNVVNPDEMVEKFGADAVRVYLAFIGPYNEPGSYPWNLGGVESMRKFLERVVRMCEKATETTVHEALQKAIARTSVKVATDGDRFKFNTAIAALMTLLNEFEKERTVSKEEARDYVLMLSPFAPHLSEHLLELLGMPSATESAWPLAAPELLIDETVSVTVQVNGKHRGTITLSKEAGEEEALRDAYALPTVAAVLNGRKPSRVVYVPGKVLNVVV